MCETCDRTVAEHIEPAAVVRTMAADHCPYCRAAADPCAFHRRDT